MISLVDRFRTSMKAMRLAKEWSQEDLGNKAGYASSYISEIERGKVTPSLYLIDDIAKVFEVDQTEMLTDKYYEEYHNNKTKVDNLRGRRRRY